MRLSRGRSTPTRRAMNGSSFQGLLRPFVLHGGLVVSHPAPRGSGSGHPSRRWSQPWGLSDHVMDVFSCTGLSGSALALLVTRVLADHHDAAVATDHLALVTDLLDARVDLHCQPLMLESAVTCTGRRCDPA